MGKTIRLKEIKKGELKEGSEVIRIYDQNSEEYKTLQDLCDRLNQASSKTMYYLQNIYFDFGQNWKYTAIIAKQGNQEWQATTPRDYENILNGNSDEVFEKLLSSNG